MPKYAYRWSDGSVSIAVAVNKDMAAFLLDEVGPISKELIMTLKKDILVTLRPEIDNRWVLDTHEKLGEELDLELMERCYPNYLKAWDDLQRSCVPADLTQTEREKLLLALKADEEWVEKRNASTPLTPVTEIHFPRGFPEDNEP